MSASVCFTWARSPFFFLIGGLYAMAFGLELLTPQGDFLSSATYNKVFTQHGIIMIFFFLIPSIPATLGNFLVPLMIGAKDLAFPRINLLSWYIYLLGGIITIYALLAGGIDTAGPSTFLTARRFPTPTSSPPGPASSSAASRPS